jgi:uncharacterized membrane protein
VHTFLLTLHVVLAIFLVGPLVAAANQSARALTDADAGALRMISRTVTIYGWASLAVGVLGLGLVRREYGDEFSDGWLIVSIVLFVLASVLVLTLLAPVLRRAVRLATGGSTTRDLVGRAAAVAGVASLCYLVIAVLMVWQPGGN